VKKTSIPPMTRAAPRRATPRISAVAHTSSSHGTTIAVRFSHNGLAVGRIS
jgi:hypothetical protein